MEYIENCVVCGKYLQTIELQDQGMCNKCDDKTSQIADEIRKRERSK